MSCVSGRPSGGEKPASRSKLAHALWTDEERARQRCIIEERLLHAFAFQFLERAEKAMVVAPPWRSRHGDGPYYVEPVVSGDEELEMAAEALGWIRRYLSPLANAPLTKPNGQRNRTGERQRAKYRVFVEWLRYRTHQPGCEGSFAHMLEERAGGGAETKEARRLKRKAYRQVEKVIRVLKIGLYAEGVVVTPLPDRFRKPKAKRPPKAR